MHVSSCVKYMPRTATLFKTPINQIEDIMSNSAKTRVGKDFGARLEGLAADPLLVTSM